jgi:Mrr N-terminal domain
MRRIEVDGEVWEAIKAHAEPLEDDANSVLRRVFGLDGGQGNASPRPGSPRPEGPRRAAPGSILSEREYEDPILLELLEREGRGQATEVTDAVGKRLEGKLTKLDYERLDSGDIRWRNRTQFTRHTLKSRGLIKTDSPRGIWELTTEGIKAAKQAKSRL